MDFRPIVTGRGACFASARITRDGARVGFLYREAPEGVHSGWHFLAGDESAEYCAVADNWSTTDVNTVANFDAGIVALVDHPPGCEYVREPDGGWRAQRTPEGRPIDRVTLADVDGPCDLGFGWGMELPGRFLRRLDGDAQVLWRRGLTLHVTSHQKAVADPREAEALMRRVPDHALDRIDETDGELRRTCYRVREPAADGRRPPFQGLVLDGSHMLNVSAYFDDEADAASVLSAFRSIRRLSGG